MQRHQRLPPLPLAVPLLKQQTVQLLQEQPQCLLQRQQQLKDHQLLLWVLLRVRTLLQLLLLQRALLQAANSSSHWKAPPRALLL
jgi:hypothetical protein